MLGLDTKWSREPSLDSTVRAYLWRLMFALRFVVLILGVASGSHEFPGSGRLVKFGDTNSSRWAYHGPRFDSALIQLVDGWGS